ncbi:hypothetical protein GWK08_18900 [Leptobacterium flavescens]|uniref:Uncharacterized protein n=1 Tax=Leptobacterium flavescens TaxID=472055 RepID=A0A6P0UQB1_9FLAO|nr:hypothetical protein [Leptobacterium flavescens]NER15531.1 hypothetical protein [Leptobacterium flavescens]
MKYNGLLQTFPKELKLFIGAFVIVLSIGYYTGLSFVRNTESHHPQGIEENYLGNEEEAEALVMKFKKGKREMLTIIHTHILSMSFIFFLLGGILYFTRLNRSLKLFLMIEPFISLLLTFGGIYLLWTGILWFKYIVMISGILMTLSFSLASLIILFQLFGRKAEVK